MDTKKLVRYGSIAALILMLLFAFSFLTNDARGYRTVDTSVAIAQLDQKNVKEAQIDDREQRLKLKLKDPISVEKRDDLTEIMAEYPARTAPVIFDKVEASGAEKYTTKVTRESFLMSMLSMLLPLLLLFGLMMLVFSRVQGSGMSMFGMGQSRAKELTKDMPTNTFADVAGADEAVDELHEIKDFLEDPARYQALGAKIPRGVLLYGPPGTGKTLLARAVAGEAGVPFFSISGSDFVEMFVGVGASRVRDLFKQAKENSPCIIFVDEIDAVGRQRGSGMGGGHDEREQTLNQMLVEMDGFDDREGVILIAATNRPDILDPALLRPGRFDRQIPVTNPDLKGRQKILQVHAKGKPFAPDVDLDSLAKRTVGMSGADLANVLNEAALLTARVGGNVITADALEEATDRVIGGPRRTSQMISEKEKKVTAYHESGHTLAAWAMKDIERVYKVTILARGRTGGHAMTAPEDDKGMYNRNELFARIVFAMGGRAAEELVFGEPTTGASNDIEQATKIARAMITEYGMSPQLGTVKYGTEEGDVFAGRGGGGSLDYSEAVGNTIDEQVRMLVNKGHRIAYEVLRDNREYLDRLASKLLEKETLRRPDLEALFDGMPQRERPVVFDGEEDYFPGQGLEPVKTPTELALERGEEPPKRFSIVEASRAARARRKEELERQQAAAAPAQGATAQGAPAAGTPAQGASAAGAPNYGAPQGWTAPGWPPAQGSNNNPFANPSESGQQPTQQPAQHPGMNAYPAPEAPANEANAMQANAMTANAMPQEPLRGFELPAWEKPDHPEKDDKSDKDEKSVSGDDSATIVLPAANEAIAVEANDADAPSADAPAADAHDADTDEGTEEHNTGRHTKED